MKKRKTIAWDKVSRNRLCSIIGFALTVCLGYGPIQAQEKFIKSGLNQTSQKSRDTLETGVIKESQLKEVTVTASKIKQRAFESGKVLIIIDSLQLEHSRGKTLANILAEQVGVIVSGANGNPGSIKSVFVRGALGQNTLILIDGIPITDPSDDGEVADLRLINLDLIERIEILKGGQSTLYGSQAVAGVINLITKKSQSKRLGLSLGLVGGSLGTYKENIGISGPLEKCLTFNLNYTHFKTDGISETVDNGTDLANTGHFLKNGFNQNAFSGSFNYHPSEKFELSPYIRYTENQGSITSGAFMGGNFPYTLRTTQTGISGRYNFDSRSTLRLTEGYTYTHRDFTSSFGPYYYKGYFNQMDAYYQKDFNKNLTAIAGFTYQYNKTGDTSSTIKIPTYHILSPYLNIILKDIDHFSLDAGLRYNHHSVYGSNFTYSLNPSYHIDSVTKLFGTISSSFRAPTLYNLYGGFGVGNPLLKPEYSTSYELGLSTLALSRKVNIRLVTFYRDGKNVINYNNALNSFYNEDRERVKGIEFETAYNPTREILLKGFYSYLTGTINTFGTGGKDSVSNYLIRRPKHSFGIFLSYQSPSAFYFNLNFRTYLGRTDEDFNTNSLVNLNGYSLLDGYAEYAICKRRIKFFVQLNNILNSSYTEIYGYTTLRFNLMSGIRVTL